jgi:hypothetical protein
MTDAMLASETGKKDDKSVMTSIFSGIMCLRDRRTNVVDFCNEEI